MIKTIGDVIENLTGTPHFFSLIQIIRLDSEGNYSPTGIEKEITLTKKPIFTYFETAKKIATGLVNMSAPFITICIQQLSPDVEKKLLLTATEEELTKYL